MPLQKCPQKDWADFVQREPRLLLLFNDIREIKDDKTKPSFCANFIWYRDFKPRMIKLAGWGCKDEVLKTCKSYDMVYEKLYNALPNCRNCLCF